MTTIAKILMAILLALFTASCSFNINLDSGEKGNGIVIQDTRTVTEEFTAISASEGLDVYITQANETSISIEADENIEALIRTDIKDGKLTIHTSENIGRATKKIYVTLPIITELKSSSGANIKTKNSIKTDKIKLVTSSGAHLKLDIIANNISAHSSSGSSIKISGNTSNLTTKASSGAHIRAKNLITKTCNAKASSGSGIVVNVLHLLNANASSGGNISYTGKANVKSNSSISGSITKKS